MGVKEDFIAWANGEITLEKWQEWKAAVGMPYNDEYFHNVINVTEKEEQVRDLPPDIGFIGGGGVMKDMST